MKLIYCEKEILYFILFRHTASGTFFNGDWQNKLLIFLRWDFWIEASASVLEANKLLIYPQTSVSGRTTRG